MNSLIKKSMIKRALTLAKRNLAAYKFGIPFFLGMARFKLPKPVKKQNTTYPLNHPVKDLSTASLVSTDVFLDDCYNLGLIIRNNLIL